MQPILPALHGLLDGGDILPGVVGFGQFWIQLDGALQVLERGPQLGDAVVLYGLVHEGDAECEMRIRLVAGVAQALLAVPDGRVEILQLALAVANSEVGEAAQLGPDIVSTRFLFLSEADEITKRVIVQLAGELAIEIAQSQVRAVSGPGFRVLSAETQAVGHPEPRLGALRRDLDGLARGFDGLGV